MYLRKFMYVALLILFGIIFCAGQLSAQEIAVTGNIKGRVLDHTTKEPLAGVNIEVLDTSLGTATDTDGYYNIPNVPVGNFRLRISYVSYEPLTQTDIIVRPSRPYVRPIQ